jgi:serine/threonine-protein kinase RsbW
MAPLTVPGTLDSLELIGKYVLAAAAEAGLDKKAAYRLRLGVDEIATNIITHGYEETGQEGVVDVQATIDDRKLTITLEDTAPAFDPLQHITPNTDEFAKPLEERGIGGLGVYLALEGTDEFLYERVDGRNRNIFIVNRPAGVAKRQG